MCVLLSVFSYIYISQGSVKMHLWHGGTYNNHIIANCPHSVFVKEFLKTVKIGENMDKSKWHLIYWLMVYHCNEEIRNVVDELV